MFRNRRHSFPRRFSKPMRQATRIWTTKLINSNEVAGAATSINLCDPTQWLTNAVGGGFQTGRLLKLVVLLTSGTLATFESRTMAITIDETSPGDPSTVAFYANTQPFWVGGLLVPTTAGVVSASTYRGWRDFTREWSLRRKLRSDQNVLLNISPAAAAGNQLVWSGLARALVEVP